MIKKLFSLLNLGAIKTYALVAVVALATGFAAGYITKGRFIDSERTSALETARKGDIRIVADAADRESRIAAALDANNDFYAFKQDEFDSLPSLIEVSYHEPTQPSANPLVCPRDPALSADLVRLLNDNP